MSWSMNIHNVLGVKFIRGAADCVPYSVTISLRTSEDSSGYTSITLFFDTMETCDAFVGAIEGVKKQPLDSELEVTS